MERAPSAEVLDFFHDKPEKSVYELSIVMDMPFVKGNMYGGTSTSRGANSLPNPVSVRH